jgi:plasmid maintenance system antidote protein VapI
MLQTILDENEISQSLLAARTGLTTKHVNFLIKDKAPLSVEVALLIEEKFTQIKAFPLLMAQLRQDVAKVKMRRKKVKQELFEYAPGQE